MFTYYLRDELLTKKKSRRKNEKAIAKEGGDTPYPGWSELRSEELEDDPAVILTVRDAAGTVVRRLSGPVSAGFHRVAWDLRYPSVEPWRAQRDARRQPRGALAALDLNAVKPRNPSSLRVVPSSSSQKDIRCPNNSVSSR